MTQTEPTNPFQGLLVAHAAVNGGMMANFGRQVAKCLIAEGAELHFFASRLPVFGWPPPIEDLESMGGYFHGLPIPDHFAPFHDLWSLVLMAVALRRLRVQVLHTRSSIMGAVGRAAAKLAGVPFVIHHQDDLLSRDEGLSPGARRLVAFIEMELARLADRSVFVSEAVLRDAIAIGFPEERCVLVGHDLHEVFQVAVNEPENEKEPVLSRLRNLGIPTNARVVGCVGRLANLKGIDLFLKAAEHLAPAFPDWCFVIKGDGPLRNSLADAILEHKLTDRVFLFTDELPSKELPALYRCFDLFALPTRREGFGMAFAEAMAMGVAVVGPRIAPVTEVVPEACGVLVEPESVPALTQALGSLMSDEGLRGQIAAKGKEHALATYCGHKAATRMMDSYRELLNG
jgi:glycosyltransferase involved in cell wall biosynthesis